MVWQEVETSANNNVKGNPKRQNKIDRQRSGQATNNHKTINSLRIKTRNTGEVKTISHNKDV